MASADWLEHGLPGRSELTREIYRDALAPLLDEIGKRPLQDLTAGEVEAGLRSLAGTLSSWSLQIGGADRRGTVAASLGAARRAEGYGVSPNVIWIEDGPAVMPEVRGLLDATAAAIVNSREDWLQRKSTVGLVAQPKQGS